MKGKVMINSDVPCTENIKHWDILVILPLLLEDFRNSVRNKGRPFLFYQKTRTATTPGGFWGKRVLVSSRYSVDGDAQPWGHHISQCLFPCSCIHDGGHVAPRIRVFLSEEFSWTIADFLHRSECLQERAGWFELLTWWELEQQPLSDTHLRPSRQGAVSTPIWQCWTYSCTTCICDCVTEARCLYIIFSSHWKVYCLHGLKAWLPLV